MSKCIFRMLLICVLWLLVKASKPLCSDTLPQVPAEDQDPSEGWTECYGIAGMGHLPKKKSKKAITVPRPKNRSGCKL